MMRNKIYFVMIVIAAGALIAVHLKAVAERPFRIRTDREGIGDEGTVHYPPKAPKRIILIAVDTLRADHLSRYGYDRRTTPSLDHLMKTEGIVFENAYSPSSWTLPSSVSLFTSLHPHLHEVEDREQTLHPKVPTLAAAFSKIAKWHTAAFVTHIYVSSLFGLDSGFDEFFELSIDWGFDEGKQLRAEALNRTVLPWLKHHRSKPFFLYLHYFDPHWNYEPPGPYDKRFTNPEYDGDADGTWSFISKFLDTSTHMSAEDLRHVIGLYDGEIAYTDHYLGRLFKYLKKLDMWDDTLLVILSDHGEEFKDHGSMHHIRTLYNEVTHVPLIVKLPGGRPSGWSARIGARVSTIDVAPTLLDLTRTPIPPSFQGKSLTPLFKVGGADRDIFMRTKRHRSDTMALIMDDKKLILPFGQNTNPVEYYDLAVDPEEKNSLTRAYPDEVAFFKEQIEKRSEKSAIELGLPGRGRDAKLTEDQKTLLKNLGYME